MSGRGWLRGLLQPGALGPIIAGLAGFGLFIGELAPQAAGFPDTDDPAVGLAFVAAQPSAWPIIGICCFVTSIALIVAAIALGDRLGVRAVHTGPARPDVAARAVTVVGLLAAAFLFGHGVVRYGGGPMLYVQGLKQEWGETAYLVTQFVGVHLMAQGGITLLAIWITAAAWLGARRGAIPPAMALLAVFPAFRLVSVLAPWGLLPDGLWIFFMASIPGAFIWLILLGVSSADTHPTRTEATAT